MQKAILKALLPHRSPDSVFADGAVLQRHAYLLSDDQDIFHPTDPDIIKIARKDMEVLRQHGYTIKSKRGAGFRRLFCFARFGK